MTGARFRGAAWIPTWAVAAAAAATEVVEQDTPISSWHMMFNPSLAWNPSTKISVGSGKAGRGRVTGVAAPLHTGGDRGAVSAGSSATIGTTLAKGSRMRIYIAAGLAAVLLSLSPSTAQAQAPPPVAAEESGMRLQADGGLLIDRIDPERLRQIRSERTRQFILGAGLVAAGGLVGFTHNEWVVDEGVIGAAIAAIGLVAIIEPVTWRNLEVRTTTNGLSLEW